MNFFWFSACEHELSHIFATHQGPLSMEFSRQEHWSGLPFPSPRDLPSPGIELSSLVSPASAGRLFTAEPLGKPFWPRVLEKRPLMPEIFTKLVFGNFFPPLFMKSWKKKKTKHQLIFLTCRLESLYLPKFLWPFLYGQEFLYVLPHRVGLGKDKTEGKDGVG